MWEKIKKKLKIVAIIILGILAGTIWQNKRERNRQQISEINKIAEIAGEKKREEIENTDAADLVANADNSDELGRITAEIKLTLRKRIRDRFRKKL